MKLFLVAESHANSNIEVLDRHKYMYTGKGNLANEASLLFSGHTLSHRILFLL